MKQDSSAANQAVKWQGWWKEHGLPHTQISEHLDKGPTWGKPTQWFLKLCVLYVGEVRNLVEPTWVLGTIFRIKKCGTLTRWKVPFHSCISTGFWSAFWWNKSMSIEWHPAWNNMTKLWLRTENRNKQLGFAKSTVGNLEVVSMVNK